MNREIFSIVPSERFSDFHKRFDGEGFGAWEICAQCGGRCELHKIGSLMPGEKDYIAQALTMSQVDFENNYLDRVVTPYGIIDVLKLKLGCPFLDNCFHCTLADKSVKPVLCEIYPVVFEVRETVTASGPNSVEVEFQLDEIDCPLMHMTYQWSSHKVHNPEWKAHRHYFQTVGIELLRHVNAPIEWYKAVSTYDGENFDYKLLEKIRDVPTAQCATLSLDQLMMCRIGHDL